MKKCTYCGKEYPDDAVICAIDDNPLSGGEGMASTAAADAATMSVAPSSPGPIQVSQPAVVPWTERQIRVFEIVLVCVVAFGGSVLDSIYLFFMHLRGHPASLGSTLSLLITCLRQLSSLALLGYVLARRSRTISDLGFALNRKGFGWSLLLFFGGAFVRHAAFRAFNYASSGLPTTSTALSAYPTSIWILPIIFHFINPFFEELIVRAYLMTEVRQLTGSVSKAIIISTVVQTSYHLYQGGPSALSNGVVFLIFSIYYARTGRIAPIILAHLYLDLVGTSWLFSHWW